MSKFSKFMSLALTITTMIGTSGALLPIASAQSTTDLQAQIAALLAQITQLQAQLGAPSGGTMTAPNFTRNLTVGSRGADVKDLQMWLNSHGYQVAASGAGSPGSETTYFGPATRAALAKFQAASGVSPAAGYFGPITRAKLASMAVTPPVTPGVPGVPGVPAPATGLAVGLASDNPVAGALISSSGSAAARVPVLAVNFTAGTSGGVTLNTVKFKKLGVLSDNSISSAYLVENGKVVAQYTSLSGGVITFDGVGLGVNAGQTRKFWLAIDVATGLSAGNTVSFALKAVTDVAAVDSANVAVTPSGTFPLNGNIFTVTSVSNPSLATLTIASSAIGTTVYAGSQNVLVSQWTLTGTNSSLDLKGINFKVVGSANKSDIKNVKLLVNGTQVGPTLAQVAADGSAYFDLSSAPARITTGSSNLQVFADITGSPSFDFTFELLNSYDVLAVDTQYGVPVTVTINGGSSSALKITIQQGQITVTLSSDTPTGNVAKGGSGTVLAKFKIYAAGEAVKVKWLTFSLVLGSGAGATMDTEIKNLSLIDDAGGQVGTTINSMVTSVTCTDTAFSATTSTATNCFGNSSSPINYIIPANTTRVLSLKGDIQSTAGFATLTGKLTGNTSNLQGLTSSQTASSGSVTGSVLTLAANALTSSKNTAVGSPNYSAGTTGVRIGSYSLTASSAEGANLTTITILTSASSTKFQNLRVMIGGSQFGITQPTLSASASYTFSGALNVPAGQTKIVDVFADVLSGTAANTYTAVTTLNGCSGSGSVTFASISCASATGQDVIIGGQATLTVAIDSASPAAKQIVMGSTNNVLGTFRFTETSNIEAVKVTDLNVFQQVNATNTTKSAFGSVKFYDTGGSLLASAGSAITAASTSNPGPGYIYQFHFTNPVVVPQAGSLSLVLKGDVSSYSASGATDNTTHVFKLASSTEAINDTIQETVVALGQTSNATSAISLATGSAVPNANAVTVQRSKVTVTAAALGSAASRAKTSIDDLATITFTADAAGAAVLNSVVITFGGSAPTAAAFLDNVKLYDTLKGQNVTSSFPTSTACSGTNNCTASFVIGATTGGYQISAGSSVTFNLRIDSTKTAAAQASIAQTLTATINAAGDVVYTDGLDSAATSGLTLQAAGTGSPPIQLNSVTFSIGT